MSVIFEVPDGDDFDDDGPRILVEHVSDHTARVAHLCDVCGQTIRPGEKYHRAAWVDDDWPQWQVSKCHRHCGGAAPDEGERNPLPPITGVPDEIPF